MPELVGAEVGELVTRQLPNRRDRIGTRIRLGAAIATLRAGVSLALRLDLLQG